MGETNLRVRLICRCCVSGRSVPANLPLRKVRELVRDMRGELNRSLSKLYASEGRPSIPPVAVSPATGTRTPFSLVSPPFSEKFIAEISRVPVRVS